MSDCLFCRIIDGELPSTKVYEDEAHLAFMDIGPANPGHLLVVPKQHHQCLAEMPEEMVGPLFVVASRLGQAAMKATAAPAFNLIVNNGQAAGQLVFHTHVHVIPRFVDDGHKHWGKKEIPEERTKALAGEISRIIKEGAGV